MASLDDVAQLARGMVSGVNWAELAQRGKNDVYQSAYIYDYLIPMAERAQAVMRTVATATLSEEGAWDAFKHAYQAVVTQSGSELIAAARAGMNFLESTTAPGMAGDGYRHFIGLVYRTALYGISLHLPPLDWQQRGLRAIGTIHLSGLSDADIAQHANMVHSLFSAIVALEKFGGLAPIKRAQGASGLGAAPVAVVVVAGGVLLLLSVAVCAVVAWCLLAIQDTSEKNRVVAEMCKRAQESGDARTTAQCLDILNDPEKRVAALPFKNAVPNFGQTFEVIAKYAFYGLLVYGAVAFAPAIVRQFKKTREAARGEAA